MGKHDKYHALFALRRNAFDFCIYIYQVERMVSLWENAENTNGVIRSRKSKKDIQYQTNKEM